MAQPNQAPVNKLTPDVLKGFVGSLLAARYDQPLPTPDFHMEMWGYCTSDARLVSIAAPRYHAKAQSLHSKVLTPTGWSTIGELSVGSYVIGGDGKAHPVTQLHPVQEMDLYTVQTHDGRTTQCNLGHLWNVMIPSNTGKWVTTKSLEQLLPMYKGLRDGEYRVQIPTCAPVEFTEKKFPVDPYMLGLWLGDGTTTAPAITTMDTEIIEYCDSYAKGHNLSLRIAKTKSKAVTVAFRSAEKTKGKNSLINGLRELGVYGSKFLPEQYLFGSVKQRVELLQGLVDTDGSISSDGYQFTFSNKNKQLIAATVSLIRSLGGYARVIECTTTCGGRQFHSQKIVAKLDNGIVPCKLARKVVIWKGSVRSFSSITNIEFSKRELGRCISVEGDTYITDDYLLTHNSSAITHAYTLASLLFRESDYCILVSDTERQAIEFLAEIKKDLTGNDDLIELFGISRIVKDTETDIVVEFSSTTNGKPDQFRIVAKGVGQRLRGLKWDQKRPNLIVIDDAENEENSSSKDQRDKLKRWVNGALIPALAKRGKVRAVGTVIHTDSWLASTLPDENSPLTVTEPLKTYSKRLTHGWHSIKYRGHPAIGDYSCFLWPEHRGIEFFKDEYERLEADGQVDVYAAEQLNNPIDETQAYFRRTDFIDFPPDVRKKMALGEFPLNLYSSIDMAVSKSQRADYTVIGTIGIDEAGQMYLLDVVRDRFDPDECAREIFKIEKEYHPGMIFVEKGLLKNVIQPLLNRDMAVKHSYPSLESVYAPGDKRTKARAIQKIMRGGGLYVDKQAEWYPAFEDEHLRFDRAPHDDQVDMMALFGLRHDDMVNAPTQEEKEEAEWDKEFGQDAPTGRDSTTGY